MDDFNDLVNEVVASSEAEAKAAKDRQYVLHKTDILNRRGADVWIAIISAAEESAKGLNDQILLRTNSTIGQVVFSKPDVTSFSIRGNSPEFSMTATYEADKHRIKLSGYRKTDSANNGRNAIMYLTLDKDGNPCPSVIDDKHPVSMAAAGRFVIEWGEAKIMP